MLLVEGPHWAEPGPPSASVLNPLRVENVMFSLVERLVPGVISTTPHARYLGLHGLVRAEAVAADLSQTAATNLMRRCEAVIAAVTIHHNHQVLLPEGHGQAKVESMLDADGGIDLAKVTAIAGGYSDAASGFYGTYRGPELVLGVIAPGPTQEPGSRFNEAVVREALGDVLALAGQDQISGDALRAAGHLCPCAATGAESAWLRGIVCGTSGGDDFALQDEARRDTARIVARIVYEAGVVKDIQRELRTAIAFGPPISEGLLAGIDLAEAWRGAMLRNYSIEAWRNIWWWLVRELKEPHTAAELADTFIHELPTDWTVADLTARLPDSTAGTHLLPAEDGLRSEHPRPHPLTELRMLALGAARLAHTDGWTFDVLSRDDDGLGPTWVQQELADNDSRPIREWAGELVERLLWRSHRIALTKLDISDPTHPRLPAQVVERDGVWSQYAPAGSGPVGVRLTSFTSMLAGCGVLGRGPDGWWLTTEGEQLLG